MAKNKHTLETNTVEINGRGYKQGSSAAEKALRGKNGERYRARTVGKKGREIPLAEAKRLGLVKDATKTLDDKAVKATEDKGGS